MMNRPGDFEILSDEEDETKRKNPTLFGRQIIPGFIRKQFVSYRRLASSNRRNKPSELDGDDRKNNNNNDKSSSEDGGLKRRSRLDAELSRLTTKIDMLLIKLDDINPKPSTGIHDECHVCRINLATMQTFPCAHQVICQICFVKRIQSTILEKKLPLRCVFCEAKILRLKQNEEKPVKFVGVSSSASNYSFNANRMSASSSNNSFLSGVSSVSSSSNASSRNSSSFNFNMLSNLQNVNITPSKTLLTRSLSASSGRKPGGRPPLIKLTPRSKSLDGKKDRTSSDESLLSSNSSPKSPISPSSSGESKSPGSHSSGNSFFSSSEEASSPSSSSSSSLTPSYASVPRWTPLSPIKEVRREDGSPGRNNSPECANLNYNRNIDIGGVKDGNDNCDMSLNRNEPGYYYSPRPSSRIRCTDKILNQLESSCVPQLLLNKSSLKNGYYHNENQYRTLWTQEDRRNGNVDTRRFSKSVTFKDC